MKNTITILACVELPVLQGHANTPLDELIVSWGKLGQKHRAWRICGTVSAGAGLRTRSAWFSVLTDGTTHSFERSPQLPGDGDELLEAFLTNHIQGLRR